MSQIRAGQTIDWAAQQAALRPPGVPAAAWSVIYGNLLNIIGSTTNSYNAALAQAATYLGGLGETTAQVSDVGALWSFLVSQADAEFPTPDAHVRRRCLAEHTRQPVPRRSTGRSWRRSKAAPPRASSAWAGRSSWQTSLSVDSSGNVSIDGSLMGYFVLKPAVRTSTPTAQYGTLTESDGVYTFTNTSGTQYVFLPNGRFEFRTGLERQPHHAGLQRPEPARHVDLFQPVRSIGADRTAQFDLQFPGLRFAGGRRYGRRLELYL